MSYLLLKALHLAAVLTWVGGLLLVGVVLGALRPAATAPLPHERQLLLAVQRWDRRVTTPAMGLAWALGLGLAMWGGWLGAGWLSGKLALVVGLSALHGMLAGRLRRALHDGRAMHAAVPAWSAPAVLAATAAVVLLVVLKPS